MITYVNRSLFTFVMPMKIQTLYKQHFCSGLGGRYITFDHIRPLLNFTSNYITWEEIGSSQNELPIVNIKIGKGPKRILAWSQMHGNESTTTKAVFDLLKLFDQKEVLQGEIEEFFASYTLSLIPMLNPDGAALYTRENANGVDLNRDAAELSQIESRVLRSAFEDFQPHLCLNLHDQRSIYGLASGHPSVVSFLAPSEDQQRTVTATRIEAMKEIIRLNRMLQEHIPGMVGRYDDTFNHKCVGDAFTAAGVPTVLFEAGHFPGDYNRERTRELIFYALLELFGITAHSPDVADHMDYFDIPENKVNFKDIILRNVKFHKDDEPVSLGIQYRETLVDDKIEFIPVADSIGDLSNFYAHLELQGKEKEILVNYQQNFDIGDKIATITEKTSKKTLFSSNT